MIGSSPRPIPPPSSAIDEHTVSLLLLASVVDPCGTPVDAGSATPNVFGSLPMPSPTSEPVATLEIVAPRIPALTSDGRPAGMLKAT